MTSQLLGRRSRWTVPVFFAVIATVVLAAVTAITIGAPQSSADAGDPPITGAIHIDYDRDGAIDAGEESLADRPPGGVIVTAYDSDGGSVVCDVTSLAPGYSCDVASIGTGPFRLELTLTAADVAAGWSDTFTGAGYGAFVQRAAAGDAANFGIVPPSQCAAANGGELFVNCFLNGDADVVGPKDDALVAVPFDNNAAVATEILADKSEIGATWGIAYDEYDDVLYTSAFLKRHTDFGSEGVDGLYYTTDDGASWTPFALGAAFGADIARDLDGVSPAGISIDSEAFPRVGKYGVGDIDVTPDGNTLIAANLTENHLHLYDVSGVAGGGAPVAGSEITVDNQCPGDHQIFAVSAVDAENAYVGITCTGPTDADLAATVVNVPFSGSAQTVVTSVPLGNYDRPCATSDTSPVFNLTRDTCEAVSPSGQTITDSSWVTWSDDYADYGITYGGPRPDIVTNSIADVIRPQPLLSDIEILDDGGLVLGLIDRTMHQIGNRNCAPDVTLATCTRDNDGSLVKTIQAAEILRVCNTGSLELPVYAYEGQTGCDPNFLSGTNTWTVDPVIATNDGLLKTNPAGTDGEFFQDAYNPLFDPRTPAVPYDWNLEGTPHAEAASGGLYYQQYTNRVVTTAEDTESSFGTGGVQWLNTETGVDITGRDLYVFPTGLGGDGIDGGTFSKAGGIGDVEGCGVPIEIGNFVWLDSNGDGIQDPNEPGIGGVTVTLTGPDGSVTKTTDADGAYLFGPLDGVAPNSDYTITFDVLGAGKNITGLPAGVTAADLEETIADAGDDQRDSDMVNGTITVTTDLTSNHTLDVGYIVPVYDLALILQLEQDQDPVVEVGDDINLSITVRNQGTLSSDDFDIVVYLPAGTELADDAWTLSDDGTYATYTAATEKLEEGEEDKYRVTLKATEPGPKDLAYAEISADSGDDVDSVPDADNGGETESPFATNDSFDAEQDDHDPESIEVLEVYDLALILTTKDSQPENIDVGEEISLTVKVQNQGNISSEDYDIVVYLPDGTALDDAAWMLSDDGSYATYAEPTEKLEPGDEGSYDIILVATEAGPKDFAWAEISADSGDDVDSEPDVNNGEEGESPLATDNSFDAEQDDHDPESITIAVRYDLALKLELDPGQNAEVEVGDPIDLSVTVENQGNVSSEDYDIVVYIPEGSELDDPDWTLSDDGVYATFTAPTNKLEPGATDKVQITLKATERNPKHHAWAEISADSGDDIDSDPDTTNGEETESPLSTDDSLVDPEDDHDGESLTILGTFDLALRKQVDFEATGTVSPGSKVVFNIEVFNQGEEPSVNPKIIDYVDVSNFMPFSAADNPAGSAAGGFAYEWAALENGNGEVSLTGTLEPEESVVIPVTLTVADDPADLLGMDNYAEITDPGSDIPDIDSTPDSDNGNDPNIDDAINDPNDEDDHDGALTPVLDLALRERYPADGELDLNFRGVLAGDPVTFEIEIFNQGNVPVKDILIVDYVPAGLVIDDDDWTVNADGTAEIMVSGVLQPGETIVTPITFRVADTLAVDAEVENLAEIAEFIATDDAGGATFSTIGDSDSTPDRVSDNDELIDDRIDDDGDEDQDDHDVLGLIVISAGEIVTPTPVPPTPTPTPTPSPTPTPTPTPTATPVPPTATPVLRRRRLRSPSPVRKVLHWSCSHRRCWSWVELHFSCPGAARTPDQLNPDRKV